MYSLTTDFEEPESIITDNLPWFDTDSASKEIESDQSVSPFVKEKAKDIASKGYAIFPNSVPLELCDACIDEFQNWEKRNSLSLSDFTDQNGRLERIVNIHQRLETFINLFVHNSSLPVQDYLFQKKTSLYTSLFFKQGTMQPIHRDIPLFWTKPAYHYFGVWVALEDTDANNGPLIVIEGGQKIPPIDREAVGKKFFTDLNELPAISDVLWNEYQSTVMKSCTALGLTIKQIHLKKGDTIVWHPLLPHGGAEIVDLKRTRLSFVMHTTPEGTPVFHQDVFFNPNRKVSSSPRWTYKEVTDNRKIANTGDLSIGHKGGYDFTKLN